MNEKLPPLPSASMRVWGHPEGYYTAEQVEAIRREAVMLCARIADDFNEQTISEWPDRIAEAISALLSAPDSRGNSEPAKPNEHADPVVGVVLPSQSVRIGGEGEKPDPQLCKFYAVNTWPELVAAMENHIAKLQAKLPPAPSLAPQRVREG